METQQITKPTFSLKMNNASNIEPAKASKIVGYSWIAMFILSIPTVLLVLEKLVVKGKSEASLQNINGNENLLYIGIAGYFVILFLDATIGIVLYSVLKYTNKKLALLTTVLRLLFVIATAGSLIALGFLEIEIYSIGVLVGYVFLIPHLFVLGYLTTTSGYLSKYLGLFMILASFSYIITIFGEHLLSQGMYDVLYPIAMIPASLAEISLGIYLVIRARRIGQFIDGY